MNRRDLLKFFSAGVVIQPLVANAPAARIIEPPKVELFKEVPRDIDLAHVKQVSVRLTTDDGSVHDLNMQVGIAYGKLRPDSCIEVILRPLSMSCPSIYTGLLEAHK